MSRVKTIKPLSITGSDALVELVTKKSCTSSVCARSSTVVAETVTDVLELKSKDLADIMLHSEQLSKNMRQHARSHLRRLAACTGNQEAHCNYEKMVLEAVVQQAGLTDALVESAQRRLDFEQRARLITGTEALIKRHKALQDANSSWSAMRALSQCVSPSNADSSASTPSSASSSPTLASVPSTVTFADPRHPLSQNLTEDLAPSFSHQDSSLNALSHGQDKVFPNSMTNSLTMSGFSAASIVLIQGIAAGFPLTFNLSARPRAAATPDSDELIFT